MGQKKRSPEYDPRVFREVDRDGMSSEQVAFLEASIPSKFRALNYTFSVLPVGEIENFDVICSMNNFGSDADRENFFQAHKQDLCDHFEDSAAERICAYHNMFRDSELFPHEESKKRSLLRDLRNEALVNKWELLPGKDIISAMRSDGLVVTELKNYAFEDFPETFKRYFEKIKDLFED